MIRIIGFNGFRLLYWIFCLSQGQTCIRLCMIQTRALLWHALLVANYKSPVPS